MKRLILSMGIAALLAAAIGSLEAAPETSTQGASPTLDVMESIPARLPLIVVWAELNQGAVEFVEARLTHSPRVVSLLVAGPLSVDAIDAFEAILSTQPRGDIRYDFYDRQLRADGSFLGFQIEVLPGVRWLRVHDSRVDELLLETDIGPILVESCGQGTLSPDLCASFDSDSDGCKDEVDPEPLVPETEPPVFVVMASPSELWPPNHKMIPVTVSVNGSDNCDPDFASSCFIVDVTSDEPENDNGDGNTEGDYEITGPLTVDLRAERAGPLKGRMYTITVKCADIVGNTATSIARVNARHSKVSGTVSGDIPAGDTMDR